jgi:dTDP-6-deoxy-L-talose 4-dehydrogenase (NAD+)
VCSGVPRSVREQVEEWLRIWGQEISLDPGVYPYPDYEPHKFWGSTRKLEKLLASAQE